MRAITFPLRMVGVAGLVLLAQGLSASSAPVPLPSGVPVVLVSREGWLTVAVHDRLLEDLLEQISRNSRVVIITGEALRGQRVSAQFEKLPLDEGLRKILTNNDAFFYYGGAGAKPAALEVVWVYPKAQGRGLEPVPPEAWASTREFERMLADRDPKRRARAIAGLIERKGEEARAELLRALADPEERVRTEALYRASAAAVDVPTNVLTELAFTDPAANVRFLALEAIPRDPSMRWVAERSLNDQSPPVRKKAQEILTQFDSLTPGPSPSAQPLQPPTQDP